MLQQTDRHPCSAAARAGGPRGLGLQGVPCGVRLAHERAGVLVCRCAMQVHAPSRQAPCAPPVTPIAGRVHGDTIACWACAACMGIACSQRVQGEKVHRGLNLPQVDLEGGRAPQERPSVAYPSIAFGVEDFDEAFKSMVTAPSSPIWLARQCRAPRACKI